MDLVTGAFRPALEGAFREAVGRLRRADPLAPLAVVAPSRRLADRLKELALEALSGGFAGIRFLNLFTFARAIYDEAVPADWTLRLDPAVPERLVRAILRLHFRDERYLSRAALRPRVLLGVLHELKAAAVPPDRALQALLEEELGLEDAGKLSELLSLYKRFDEELRRRRLHERSDVVRLAAEHAPRSAWLGSLRHVLYYGFTDLDQNQIDLFRQVVRRVPATVFFPHADRPAYAFARPFLQEVVDPLASSRTALASPAPTPRLTQVACSGAADEIWAAAKEILRLSDAGVPYARIGVVARTLDAYTDLVDVAFREHRIPWTSSAMRRLDRDPRAKAARLLFTVEGFDRARVLDLLRSPFFRRDGGDPDLWDQASRLLGVGRGEEEWRRRLGKAAGKDWVHESGRRAGGRRFVLPRDEVDRFWSCVKRLLEAPAPPEKSWKAYAEWALDRLDRFLEPDARIRGAVASLADLEGFALEEPLEALLEALRRVAEPAGGPAGVQVLDAMAARGLSFDALIVLGLNEKVFPRFILPDAFLSEGVRQRLVHRLGCRIASRMDAHGEELLLFELLLGAAPEVVLVHQRSDERGRLQVPSPLLPPGKPVQVPRRPSLRLAQAPFALLTPREASLRTGRGVELAQAVGRDASPLVAAREALREIERRGPPGAFDGVVDTREYWPRLASFGVSPTALERLAECPFRFFAGRMLDLEELGEPEEEEALSALEIGQLYHDVLEQFHRHGDLERRMEEGFRDFERTRSIRYPVLWEVEKARARTALKAFVDADDCSVFKPADFEAELKAALPVGAGGVKSVVFRGFVDRLDRAADGAFRVVDYKKSRRKYPWIMETGVFAKGRYLQPPLYFLLAERTLKGAVPERSKFSYYFVEAVAEGEDWEMELPGELMGERVDEFLEKLSALLATIAAGAFPIRPGTPCATCEFRTMCRRGHLPTRLRAEAAP
jgi:ATP-dependent helicase/nuclease subunit B